MTSAANPAANTTSSSVWASDSMLFNISKPPLPRFSTSLTTQQTGPSFSTQKMMKQQSVTSKSSQSSHAASSSQMVLTRPVDMLNSKPPLLLSIMFVGFDNPEVDHNAR